MKLRKNLGIELLAIVIAIGFGFSKGVSPVASQDDMPLTEIVTDWSPDGSQILFTSNRSGDFDVWTINPDGSNMTNLTNNYSGADGFALWSPDGETIAFRSYRESEKSKDGFPNADLWIMEPAGSNPINLTADIEENVDAFAWSPDSKYLAFMVTTIDFDAMEIYSEIWIIELATGEKSRIAPISGDSVDYQNYTFTYPDWTLDGRLGFIVAELEQAGEIWISPMTESSSLVRIPINQPLTDMDLSPDGLFVVCTTNSDIDGEGIGRDLILIDIQNGDVTNLTPGMSGFNADPEWSLDSSKIVFRSTEGDFSDIWVVSVDGSGLTNLSADYDSFDSFPIWSPSGEQIAFVSDRLGESTIWVMNADGSNPINLLGNVTETRQ